MVTDKGQNRATKTEKKNVHKVAVKQEVEMSTESKGTRTKTGYYRSFS